MIIGITGKLASGKGTIVDYLKNKGFKHYSVRDFLIKEIKKRGLEVNRDSMVLIANDLRENYSSSYLAEELYETAKGNGGDVIIESLRTVGEVEALRKKDDFHLFSVDAGIIKRYERALKRGSETDRISFEDFVLNEEREIENDDPSKQNLKRCMELSDYKFSNDGTFEELYRDVEKVIEKINLEKKGESISWDEYFMGVALLSAKRSKDPSTKVGACVVTEDKKIVGTGYNWFVRGSRDEDFPLDRNGTFLETKYAYVCHAELNAVLNSTKESLKDCMIYVALFPCNECSKVIVQSGIKKIIYLSDKFHDLDSCIASRRILDSAGVKCEQFIPTKKEIKLKFE